MKPTVAIVGAGGFIGSRAVEVWHLGGLAEVRPIVRSVSSLARLSRFDLDCRLADARDEPALRAAFSGCDAVILAVAGDPSTIVTTASTAYRAAQDVGVRRLVYLSSASVHGQAPEPGTDERTVLKDRQPIPYNNAKVRAERRLMRLRNQGTLPLVIIRPGIVTGPRSFWVESFASDLLAGRAYLIDEGAGICNSIYVDNVVHALYLSLTASGADGEAFLIGDDERITWADFYRPIAVSLGFDLRAVPNVRDIPQSRSWTEVARSLKRSRPARSGLSMMPKRWRAALQAAVTTLTKPEAPSHLARSSRKPVIPPTLEMRLLQRCSYKLPDAKARRLLGYSPVVPFSEACRRTVGWLAFAGFPVIEETAQRGPNVASSPLLHD